MKLKVIIAILMLSLVVWAQAPAATPKGKTDATECACCKGMAKDHTCADCCKDGKCDMKMHAEMMKDGKTACMGEKGCCAGMMKHGDMAGMNHEDMKHDSKADGKTETAMGPHCMMGKDGKKSCCGGMKSEAEKPATK